MVVSADDNYLWLCLNRTIVSVSYDTQFLTVFHTCKTVPMSRTMLWICDNTGFYQWGLWSYKYCCYIFRESQVILWLYSPRVRAVMHSGKQVFCHIIYMILWCYLNIITIFALNRNLQTTVKPKIYEVEELFQYVIYAKRQGFDLWRGSMSNILPSPPPLPLPLPLSKASLKHPVLCLGKRGERGV